MGNKKPISELEEEFSQANEHRLVDSVACNPHLSQCYILVTFHKSTNKKTRLKILEYIEKTYDIIDAQLLDEDDSIYISYDYWARYVREGGTK